MGAHGDVILRNNIQSSLAIPHQQPQLDSADFIPRTPTMASCNVRVDHSHSRVCPLHQHPSPTNFPPSKRASQASSFIAHSRPTNTPSPRLDCKPSSGVATGLPKMSGRAISKGRDIANIAPYGAGLLITWHQSGTWRAGHGT